MPHRSNKLLSSLSTRDFDLVAPHLRSVTLGTGKMLERPNERIEAVYFPETGFASVVAVQRRGKEVGVGLIGREGMTGLPACSAPIARPSPSTCRAKLKGCREVHQRATPSDTARACPFGIPS